MKLDTFIGRGARPRAVRHPGMSSASRLSTTPAGSVVLQEWSSWKCQTVVDGLSQAT